MKLVNTMQVYPIRGNRYKCQDCTELIGFDLCEACYNSSSKLPGRFNQRHTPDHRMELDNSSLVQLPRILGHHGVPQQVPEGLVLEEAVLAPGVFLQMVVDIQGVEGNDGGPGEVAVEEPVGAPGAMPHIAIHDQEMEGNEEDQAL